ncbi:MAG TPA: VanZ family protein [Candidatus Methylomirabilis sp.]|nr:VanZ family protein [Candidatus Methylomirabilis sp.]
MSLLRFLPPVAWTAVIAWLSSPGWSSSHTGRRILPLFHWLLPWLAPEQLEALHWLVRKSAHFVEYGILAVLWRVALGGRGLWRAWLAPLGLAVVTASLDELHQATTLTRMGSPLDVLLDSTGAAAFLTVLNGGPRAAIEWLTTALLWFAALGGPAMIALDWTAGARAGWLWWSVPASWLALFFWNRRTRPLR